jgi:pentatricopeptide repeat protein
MNNMLDQLNHMPGIAPDNHIHSHFLKHHIKNNDMDNALLVFSKIKNPDLPIFNQVIRAFAKNGQIDEVLSILHTLLIVRGLEPDNYTLISILTAFFNDSNNHLGAIKAFRLLTGFDGPVDGNSYQHQDDDIDIFDEKGLSKANISQKVIKPDVKSFAYIIVGLCRMGQYSDSISWLNYMQREHMLRPTVSILSSIMYWGCKNHNALLEARAIFDSVSSKYNLSPDLNMFNILLQAYAQKGEVRQVQFLLNSMIKKHSITPTVKTFTLLVKAFLDLNDLKTALKFYDLCKSNGIEVNQQIYVTLLVKLCHYGINTPLCELNGIVKADHINTMDTIWKIYTDYLVAFKRGSLYNPGKPVAIEIYDAVSAFFSHSRKVLINVSLKSNFFQTIRATTIPI